MYDPCSVLPVGCRLGIFQNSSEQELEKGLLNKMMSEEGFHGGTVIIS